MKQFKFQNKASIITGIKEEKPKKKRNWDRLIYMGIFILMIVSLGIYIIQKNLYVYSLGEVITERFEVTQPTDVEVTKYFVAEGDVVKQGDTLFSFRSDFRDIDNDGGDGGFVFNNIVIDKPNEWIVKERMNTRKSISLKYIDIRDIDNNIVRTNADIERLKMEVHLDLISPAVLQQKRMEVETLKVERQRTVSELGYLQNYLKQLDSFEDEYKQYQTSRGLGNGGGSSTPLFSYYTSPVDGIITKIPKPEREISFRQDVIMYISNLDEIFIRAFIEQNDLEYFEPGDVVNLRFLDGTKSKGRIREFYVNTESVPEPFRKIRGKDQRNVVAVVTPINDEEKKTWKSYYQFTVQVYKLRFF